MSSQDTFVPPSQPTSEEISGQSQCSRSGARIQELLDNVGIEGRDPNTHTRSSSAPVAHRPIWHEVNSCQTSWRSRYACIRDAANWQQLANTIYESVRAFLIDQRIKVRHFHQENFRNVLPRPGMTEEQHDVWKQLMWQPMTVCDDDLKEIFDMEQSDENSGEVGSGHHFYVRSWEFSRAEFVRLLSLMNLDGKDYEEVQVWGRLFRELRGESAPQSFTVRYVGTCQTPSTPYRRYKADLRSRTSGVFGTFLHTIEQHFPEISNERHVWMLKKASIPFNTRLGADARERFLIALFDHASLLNRAFGGFYASYDQRKEDVVRFQRLGTDVFDKSDQMRLFISQDMEMQLEDHFLRTQTWTNSNPELSGAIKYPFTDELRDAMYKRAKPYLYRKHVILCLAASDIPLNDYLNPETADFFFGGSQSGTLACDYLRKIRQLEFEQQGHEDVPTLFAPGLLCPFVDLWFCLKHERALISVFVDYLKNYLTITQPLVVVGYSFEVSSVLKANLTGDNGIACANYLNHVGVPSVQFYGPLDSHCVCQKAAYILVPHLHPGMDKYRSSSRSSLRLMDLTYHITFLLCHGAMAVVDEISRPTGDVLTRYELCNRIMDRFRTATRTGPGAELLATLTKVKSACRDEVCAGGNKSRAMLLPSGGERPFMGSYGQKLIQNVPIARGKRRSGPRMRQLEQIWKHHEHVDLHMRHPKTPGSKQAWMDEYSRVAEGTYYLLHACSELCEPGPDGSSAENVKYVKALLARYRPRDAPERTWEDGSWIFDARLRSLAIARASETIGNVDKKYERLFKRAMLSYPDPLQTEEMEDLVLLFDDLGRCSFLWRQAPADDGDSTIWTNTEQTEGDKVHKITLKSKSCAKILPDDVRRIRFTEFGIDIISGHGKRLQPPFWIKGSEATFPMTCFLIMENGVHVTSLWKSVRRHLGHTVQGVTYSEDCRAWNSTPGLPLSRCQNHSPPGRLDAIWLLLQFIDRVFPDGGVWETVSSPRVPGARNHANEFVEFLNSPEFIRHPYSGEMAAQINRAGQGLFGRYLPRFRYVCTERHSYFGDVEAGIRPHVLSTVYWIAPDHVEPVGRLVQMTNQNKLTELERLCLNPDWTPRTLETSPPPAHQSQVRRGPRGFASARSISSAARSRGGRRQPSARGARAEAHMRDLHARQAAEAEARGRGGRGQFGGRRGH